MRWIPLVCVALLAGCVETSQPPPTGKTTKAKSTSVKRAPARSARKAPSIPTSADKQRFASVVRAVEPAAEKACRARTKRANCDFRILVDKRKGQPANAFQTIDRQGRPILIFNDALIADVRNRDELAFVMGHEAAHHIAGHIAQKRQNAALGTLGGVAIAAILGGGSGAIQSAAELGGGLGGRAYSKKFELQADALGTVITRRAGFNPVRGAQFFTQLPDPGNVVLGTHPPHADRLATVKRVNAGL